MAFDGEIGASGDEIERGPKGAKSGFVDGLNGDDGGDPNGQRKKI